MYTVTVRTEFNAAHKLRNYHGKCESLHGHNWVVEVAVRNKKLDKTGMVMDFNELKKKISSIVEDLDHKFLNELEPFKKKNPTSENIARFIYDGLKHVSKNIARVTVWETATSLASYEETNG